MIRKSNGKMACHASEMMIRKSNGKMACHASVHKHNLGRSKNAMCPWNIGCGEHTLLLVTVVLHMHC